MKKLLSILLLLAMFASVLSFELPVAASNEVKTATDAIGEEEELPSSVTLVGSKHLPPISNQGEVGCCSSSAIAYMQFTNAVSRYIEANEPDKTFEPATGEKQYLMSPKFTYFLSGSGTAYVYSILLENGCLTMDRSSFYYDAYKGYTYHKKNKPNTLNPEYCDWDVAAGEMEAALNYRLTNYEQIWMNDVYKVDGKVQLTNTEVGQQLLEKIKKSLVNGNVVVTGGLSSVWTGYSQISKKGDLAKKGEHALAYSAGKPAGGHQVCIVGYDDQAECRVQGVTLKGAFLVANSWGTSWMNDGYVWLMYDALNQVSEYDALNVTDRYFTMDQFCFTDWRTDITSGMPELYLELTVTAENRDTVYFETLRKETATGGEKYKSYFMFRNTLHPKLYNDEHQHGSYFNFAGEADGKAVKGIITLSYYDLLQMEEGKDFSDCKFGFAMRARYGDFIAHSAVLKNADGVVIAEMDLGDQTVTSTTKKLYFEEELYKVELSAEAGEGYSIGKIDGYYPKGAELNIAITPDEHYLLVSSSATANGKALEKNESGGYTLKVEGNTVVKVEAEAKDPSKECAVSGYKGYVTKDTVEFYILFTEASEGKTVTVLYGEESKEVTVGEGEVFITLPVSALDETISVKYEENGIAEYSLRAYLTAVAALETANNQEKAVATALLSGSDYTEYLITLKSKEEE